MKIKTDQAKQPKKKQWVCVCGFVGGSRNIREHRMNCEAWHEHWEGQAKLIAKPGAGPSMIGQNQ